MKRRITNACDRHPVLGFFAVVVFLARLVVPAADQAGGLVARHRTGQTLLTWKEVDSPVTGETIAVKDLKRIRREFDTRESSRYRVYRSDKPIVSVGELEPIAEVRALSCWNADYYGIYPKPDHMARRYVVEDGAAPVPPGTGIYAHNPSQAGEAYYAVTVVTAGTENKTFDDANTLRLPVHETVGLGVPVLQRVERPERFNYVSNPTLHYYVRWESRPNCAMQGKPYDYVVAIPPNVKKPAPVGIHLHCWGANLNGGYGWWYKGEDGHILVASNQIPYDWWTGYHELYWRGAPDEEAWKAGVVRPYSQVRMLSFLDWVATRRDVDLARTHVAGSSMGGSGSPMLAIRFPDRIAWATSWVGVHDPAKTPTFKGSYEKVYGRQAWNVKFADGHSVWDHFSDAWYLRQYPEREVGLICFSNGKNDGGIGWAQSVEFYGALRDTRRPHVFTWGQGGHGQRARLPVSLQDRAMPWDLRTNQSLPAFAGCSLDDDPGDGDPNDGDAEGQANLYLYWETDSVVDQPDRWEMTVGLVGNAPDGDCTVDITPRRVQRFVPNRGEKVRWTNTTVASGKPVQSGEAVVDKLGLVTLNEIAVSKGKNRLSIIALGADSRPR